MSEALYPAALPFHQQTLAVGDGHQLYIAEFGSADGTPALFLHGGPGTGCSAQHARLFDPQRYRVIQVDQRGAGRSTPVGETRDNDLAALIADLETLRQHLQIERWLVYGGSWGATLALEYAKRHARRIVALVLRAPFLARESDLDWFSGPSGLAKQLPEAYAKLCHALGGEPGDDLYARLHDRLSDDAHPDSAYHAALAWDHWEAAVMGTPPAATEPVLADRTSRIARKRVFAHYCRHRFFLGDDGVMAGIDSLREVHGTIVHGTHDRVCRHAGAELLAHHVSGLQLHSVEGAGHGLHETALQRALRAVLDQHTSGSPA